MASHFGLNPGGTGVTNSDFSDVSYTVNYKWENKSGHQIHLCLAFNVRSCSYYFMFCCFVLSSLIIFKCFFLRDFRPGVLLPTVAGGSSNKDPIVISSYFCSARGEKRHKARYGRNILRLYCDNSVIVLRKGALTPVSCACQPYCTLSHAHL